MSLGALLLGLALLGANGFFVAAEFALLAARRSRMEQLAAEGDPRAGHALAGIRELSLMLAGAQLGITAASLGLGAVAEPALHHGLDQVFAQLAVPRGVSTVLSLVIALSVVVFLHMVVGEMAPKSWAISDPERAALALARWFRLFTFVLRPFIRLLNAMANAVVRACGVEPRDDVALTHSPADVLLLVRESGRHGMLGPQQQRMLARAIELTELDAEAVMVPRNEIVALPVDADVDEMEAVASRTGRSRLPVYDGELDELRGIVHVKDVLCLSPTARERTTAADLARPALVVPESRPVEDLMLDMRQQRQHVAMVVDEYGTVTGLAALEDVLEELIGEFEDETDQRVRPLRRRADGTILAPGTLRPDELADRTGISLPAGEWETVAGYVIAQLGRLPDPGDEVSARGAQLTVTKVDGLRVVEVAVRAVE